MALGDLYKVKENRLFHGFKKNKIYACIKTENEGVINIIILKNDLKENVFFLNLNIIKFNGKALLLENGHR